MECKDFSKYSVLCQACDYPRKITCCKKESYKEECEENLKESIKILREYCETTECGECLIRKKLHCDDCNNVSATPYSWSELN